MDFEVRKVHVISPFSDILGGDCILSWNEWYKIRDTIDPDKVWVEEFNTESSISSPLSNDEVWGKEFTTPTGMRVILDDSGGVKVVFNKDTTVTTPVSVDHVSPDYWQAHKGIYMKDLMLLLERGLITLKRAINTLSEILIHDKV